jgi:hypothetical protein
LLTSLLPKGSTHESGISSVIHDLFYALPSGSLFGFKTYDFLYLLVISGTLKYISRPGIPVAPFELNDIQAPYRAPAINLITVFKPGPNYQERTRVCHRRLPYNMNVWLNSISLVQKDKLTTRPAGVE